MTFPPSRHLAVAVAGTLISLLAAAPAEATVTNAQSADAGVIVNGRMVANDRQTAESGNASALARFRTIRSAEARGAGRSSVRGEIAANVRLDDRRTYSFLDVDALGNSGYSISVEPDSVFVRRATFDFALPPSFLEVTSNAEFPDNLLEMSISATLRACYEVSFCAVTSENLFSFKARLRANYLGIESLDIDVSGAAGLDLGALRTPVITDTGNAPVAGSTPFFRTVTVDFSAFTGQIDLGELPVGTPLTIEYDLRTRGLGQLIDNIGLAGINDPFVLDTDPLPPGRAPSLTLTPVDMPVHVSAPGPLALVGLGLGALMWMRRPGQRRRAGGEPRQG